MASKLLSTDQQNFVRSGIICVELIKLVLKDILRIQIQPKDLYTAIKSCAKLTTGRYQLRPEQKKLCFLPPPFIPDYDKFGVSLLFTLIRNLCPSYKPTQGWGKTPATTDIQIGDDIERLRLFRNGMFAHLKSTAVPDTEFTQQWKHLETIIRRIQAFVISKGYSANYEKELTNIEQSDFGFEDMEKCKIFFEGMMHLLKQTENADIPRIEISVIKAVASDKVVSFEVKVEPLAKFTTCSITWQKLRKNVPEVIDTSREKYKGSTDRRLVIQGVSKEDEGGYQAVISWERDGQIHNVTSNIINYTAVGDDNEATDPEIIPTEHLLRHMKTELTTVRHARGILVGCAGAGKTTLLYTLMGKSLDEIKNIKSTRGLQVYEHIFSVKDGSLQATDSLSAPPLIRVPKSLLTAEKDKSGEPGQKTIVDTDNLPKGDESRDGIEENINLPSCSDNSASERSATFMTRGAIHNTPDTPDNDIVVKTLSPEVIKKILDAQENEITVSMFDFAGQFVYYACHQIYMRTDAFYILVMDITKSFEEVVSGKKEEQQDNVFCTWTNKDYVEFWLDSIKSLGGPKAPVLIVATHTEDKTEDDIRNFFKCFWKSLPQEDKMWLSKNSCKEIKGNLAFGLLEMNEKGDFQKLKSLKDSIVNLVSNKLDTKIQVRSSWALLEHLLQNTGKQILSCDEIKELNRQLPEEYRLESEKEIPEFLAFFHAHGILLYFKGEATQTHAILGIQWFSNAFSKLIADEKHINEDCLELFINEWERFNQTGKLDNTLVDALWEDKEDEETDKQDTQSYIKYKIELMSYMERLRMLVKIGEPDNGKSWYIPCMNKKKFKQDISEKNSDCLPILCFRFTSFAMFVFYRLIAYCMSFLRWDVADDEEENDKCLFQTAAIFEYECHTVVLFICNNDIHLEVTSKSTKGVDTLVSCEIGNLIHNALEELTKTFCKNTVLSFQKGYKCKNMSFIPKKKLCESKYENIQCPGCPVRKKHEINVHKTLRHWEQIEENPVKDAEIHQDVSQSTLEGLGGGACSAKFQTKNDNTLRSKELDAIYAQGWQQSVGYLVYGNGRGTAFRVGRRYLMTAFHVIKDALDMCIDEIIKKAQSDPNRKDNYSRLLEKLQVNDDGTDIEMKIEKGIKEWKTKSYDQLKIESLLSAMKDTGFSWTRDQAMDFLKGVPMYVNFGRMREHDDSIKYPLRTDIQFYSETEADDIALLEINWADLPRPFILDKSGKQPENVYIIGHPSLHGSEQVLDSKCPLISDRDALETHYRAEQWWRKSYPALDHRMIRNAYDGMLDKKKVLFHCSKSTTYGASGSPGIIDLDLGMPKVYLMLKEGFPGFAHTIMKDGIKNCPEEYLVESGISMSTVYELLSGIPLLKELRDDIFHT